ncbi:MAG: hypothetical protein JXM73_21190 [Anaerolineae bacterium]|nr:hypothetical protein [Anaerolineae bacterium]
MKKKRTRVAEAQNLCSIGRVLLPLIVLLLFVFSVLWSAAPVAAQSGGDYDLSWNTVASGGGTSSGGGYTLSSTAGQPDPGLLTGGGYSLGGGFWGGGALPGVTYHVYLPVVVRQSP